MDEEKKEFIKGQIFSLTITAGLSRGYSIYKNASRTDKSEFHVFLKNGLEGYGRIYKKKVDEEKHINNIRKLKEEINKHKGLQINFGRTQKLLNLYLKYLWTLNEIPVPPHCPFDSIIILKLKAKVPPWTRKDFRENHYRELAYLADNIAKNSSCQNISEWELSFWNKYYKKQLQVFKK